MNPTTGAHPPPLPPRPATPGAPAPRSGRTGCLIALAVVAVCGLAVVGILAAIAVPAYHDYLGRAKVSQTLAEIEPVKLAVAEFHAQVERCPRDGEVGGLGPGLPLHGTVALGEEPSGACVLDVVLRDVGTAFDGKHLRLEYDVGQGRWHCGSDLRDTHLPPACRD